MNIQTNDVQEPLDFGGEDNGESQELREYKKLVREVALAAKRRERWCQDGFDEAMEKLGIQGEEKAVTIKVTTSHPFEFEVQAIPSQYQGLTWDEQRDKALAQVNDQLRRGPFTMVIPAESVTGMEVIEHTEEAQPPSNLFIWARNSPHNKYHLFGRQEAEIHRGSYHGSVTASCGSVSFYAADVLDLGVAYRPDAYLLCRNCDR